MQNQGFFKPHNETMHLWFCSNGYKVFEPLMFWVALMFFIAANPIVWIFSATKNVFQKWSFVSTKNENDLFLRTR